MPRPSDINFAVGAWVITIVLSTIASAQGIWRMVYSQQWRDEFEKNKADGGMMGRSLQSYPDFESYRQSSLLMGFIMLGAVAVVAGVLVLLLWKGQRWARMLLQVGGALVLAQALLAIFGVSDPWIAVPTILAGVTAIAALITGNSKDSIRYLNGPRR